MNFNVLANHVSSSITCIKSHNCITY